MSGERFRLDFSYKGRCDVFVGDEVLGTLAEIWRPNWRRAVVIGDHTVFGLFSKSIKAALSGLTDEFYFVGFEPGESSKTRATKEFIEDSMFKSGLDRNSCVVALGGGVSLDLAGFVAATYMRGVDWISFPTTLLAQVDASVGGKTGVDTPYGKNLLGAFHQPVAVFSNTSWLGSLPELQWKNGLAEVVKTAWVGDEDLVEELEKKARIFSTVGELGPDIIGRCAKIKAHIVQADEREQGHRAWLNFGHTVGHAAERASAYKLSHGLAVAFGMVVESRIAERIFGLDSHLLERLQDLLSSLKVPYTVPVDFDKASAYLAADKKNRESRLRMALPQAVGKMARDPSGAYTVEVDEDLVREAWGQ